MFEVQDLKYATLATVSRCGMVWFSEDVLSTDMIFNNFLARLRSIPLDEGEDEAQRRRKGKEDEGEEAASPMLQVRALWPLCRVWPQVCLSKGWTARAVRSSVPPPRVWKPREPWYSSLDGHCSSVEAGRSLEVLMISAVLYQLLREQSPLPK